MEYYVMLHETLVVDYGAGRVLYFSKVGKFKNVWYEIGLKWIDIIILHVCSCTINWYQINGDPVFKNKQIIIHLTNIFTKCVGA